MSNTRIMVVEDERIVALNLKQRLTKLGYEVTALATSGQGALREIDRTKPDVVLMDINIEGDIDGIETASRIPPDLRIPVIYLSAYSEETTLERARSTKPYGYLLKPFSERELHATIQMALERRRTDANLQGIVDEQTASLETANSELQKQVIARQKAEEALHQAQKMEAIGQLTGGIAHDFNNLLQGIVGSLSLAERRILQVRNVEAVTFIGDAMSSAKRASTLTSRLLAFARRTPIDPRTIDCNELLGGMEALLQRTIGENLGYILVKAKDLWPVQSDVGQLENAILNLVINARDAMPDGGRLRIETANIKVANETTDLIDIKAGEFVCITVTDSGTGMTPDVLARAFEPFFTTKPIGQGTGLGLSMVYGFARQFEGHVKIDSVVGRGTSVGLYLPRLQANAEDQREVRPPAAASGIKVVPAGEVVLIVEDDPTVSGIVVEVVQDLGYVTLLAADGPSGLAILKGNERIDLLVTDVGLPGLNGRQIADAGCQIRPGLKVLFMTGYAESATATGFLGDGMEIVTKPFDIDHLAGVIQDMLHR